MTNSSNDGGVPSQTTPASPESKLLAIERLTTQATVLYDELKRLVELGRSASVEIDSLKLAVEAAKAGAESAKGGAEGEHGRAAKVKSAIESILVEVESERGKALAAVAEITTKKDQAQASMEEAFQSKTTAETASAATVAERQRAQEASEATTVARSSAEEDQRKAFSANTEASESAVNTKRHEDAASTSAASAKAAEAKAIAAFNIASELVKKAEIEAKRASEAHNLSTTAGLAGAFNEKALGTKGRERFWGLVLVGALSTAAAIGWIRYTELTAFLGSRPDISALAANVFLALLGVGAPIWLAWMSTKMISKNFALTEDYAYKASLAKAYVGFRQEAKGLDPLFEQRLFAAAITQLDANPVRFIDSAHPGSPLQDLLQQPFMQEFLENPTIKQQLVDWLKLRFRAKVTMPSKADTQSPK